VNLYSISLAVCKSVPKVGIGSKVVPWLSSI